MLMKRRAPDTLLSRPRGEYASKCGNEMKRFELYFTDVFGDT